MHNILQNQIKILACCPLKYKIMIRIFNLICIGSFECKRLVSNISKAFCSVSSSPCNGSYKCESISNPNTKVMKLIIQTQNVDLKHTHPQKKTPTSLESQLQALFSGV